MIFWLISQFFIAIQSNNISWEAHISGFLFGYLLLKVSNLEEVESEIFNINFYIL